MMNYGASQKTEPRGFLSEATKAPIPRRLNSKLRFNFFAEGNIAMKPLSDQIKMRVPFSVSVSCRKRQNHS